MSKVVKEKNEIGHKEREETVESSKGSGGEVQGEEGKNEMKREKEWKNLQ